MGGRLRLYYLLALFVLLIAVLTPPVFAYQQANTLTLLSVNSDSYPQIETYLAVMDQQEQTPITGLTAADFFATTSDGQTLTVETVTAERRPLQIVVVVDVTSSVADTELANQKRAVATLTERLQTGDQLGIVALTPNAAQVVSPLNSDYTQVLAALNRIQVSTESGNVYWDAVYGALLLFQSQTSAARRAVILITDVSAGGGEGTRTEQQSLALAIEQGVEIYGLYFEFEGDEIPAAPPVLPQELTGIAQGTGGIALGTAATLRGEDYRDDEALPAMMQSAITLLSNEYRLTLRSPLPEDGQVHRFEVGLLENGTPLPVTATGQFTAGESLIQIGFTGITEEQDINLPFDLPLTVQARTGTVQSVEAFYVDAGGQETALGSIDPAQLVLSLSDLPPGLIRLRIVATDSAGNTSENSILLNVVDTFDVEWLDPPQNVTEEERISLQASVGLANTVQQVTLLVNGEEREVINTPPFDNVTFQWQPPASGDYRLEVLAEDNQGNTASQEIRLRVEPAGGLQIPNVVPVLLGGIFLGVAIAGSGVYWMFRRRRQAMPITPAGEIVPPPAPTQRTVLAYAALEVVKGGEKWRLVQGENTIGRHSTNMIHLRDESASRYHAKVEVIGRRYFLSDWQASHPSEVNGVLLAPDTKQEIYIGDTLRIGSTLLKLVAMES